MMIVGDWVYKRAKSYPERPFVKQANIQYNNKQFNERVNKTAHALMDLGLRQGDRASVLMVNSSEFIEVFFACAKTGIIMVPLNINLALPELNFILNDCQPQVFIYSSGLRDKVNELPFKEIGIKHLLTDRGDSSSLQEVIAACPVSEPPTEKELLPDSPLLIMYTSGTAGDPKGAVLTHMNFLFGAIHSLIGYNIGYTCKSLVVAPLYHIGALAASVTPVIYAGGSIIIQSFDNPSKIVQIIETEKVNYMFAVPVMFELMAQSSAWQKADFSHIHCFISGGAPIPVPLLKKYQEEKGIRFTQGYGMTETLRLTSLDLEDAIRKPGSVGKEEFHTELRIVDDHSADVAVGETGEVVVKGPTVFKEYWNKPAETRRSFKEGWFYTGDLARRDDEGYVYIVGRKIDLIISSGKNIYPQEVERAILSYPKIKTVAVVGMPDPKRGEVVAAFIVLKPDETIGEGDLFHFLQGKIATYKIPKHAILVNKLPQNGAGKILKRELRKQLGS
ncbi:AMP-binding protein [bacterium]|nr:AMP-binding protein [bacterium]